MMLNDDIKPLFVQWCAKDALDGMQQLDPLTELAYRRIIDMIYATNDKLRDDDKVLQYSTKLGSKWKAIKEDLIEVHNKLYVEGGFIKCKNCTKKLQKSRVNIEQKREAGKAAAAKAKSLKDKGTGLAADIADDPATAPTADIPAEPSNRELENYTKIDDEIDLTETIFNLGEKIAEITGWKDDPRWFGNYSRLGVWINNGWDFYLDILPTVQKVMKAKKNGPPSTLKYFEKAIADTYATRTAPIPKGTPNDPRTSDNRSSVDAMLAGFADAIDS